MSNHDFEHKPEESGIAPEPTTVTPSDPTPTIEHIYVPTEVVEPAAETTAIDTLEQEHGKNHKKMIAIIAGIAIGAIAVGVGVGISKKHTNNNNEPIGVSTKTPSTSTSTQQPSASPTVYQTITATESFTAHQDAANLMGKTMAVDYENLNVHIDPTDPLIAEALKPVPVAQYTPVQALQEFGRKLNVYQLSGIHDKATPKIDETTDSIAAGDQLLSAIFGEQATNAATTSLFDNARNMRAGVAILNSLFPRGVEQTVDNKTRAVQLPTYHTEWDMQSEQQNPDESWTFTVTESETTNYGTIYNKLTGKTTGFGAWTNAEFPETITLTQQDGNWIVRSDISTTN